MADSLLKKEWREEDIKRVRNLITGHYGNATKDQIGYSHVEEQHKEGDVWEENGKTWTIKEGLKQTVSKLSAVRQALRMPLVCPKCGKALNTALDKKMYPIHGFCFDCVCKMEDDLKRAGLYQEYEKNLVEGNIRNFVQELKDRIKHISKSKVEYSTDQGELEDWGDVSDELVQSLDQWANLLVEKLGESKES